MPLQIFASYGLSTRKKNSIAQSAIVHLCIRLSFPLRELHFLTVKVFKLYSSNFIRAIFCLENSYIFFEFTTYYRIGDLNPYCFSVIQKFESFSKLLDYREIFVVAVFFSFFLLLFGRCVF